MSSVFERAPVTLANLYTLPASQEREVLINSLTNRVLRVDEIDRLAPEKHDYCMSKVALRGFREQLLTKEDIENLPIERLREISDEHNLKVIFNYRIPFRKVSYLIDRLGQDIAVEVLREVVDSNEDIDAWMQLTKKQAEEFKDIPCGHLYRIGLPSRKIIEMFLGHRQDLETLYNNQVARLQIN